MKCNESLMVVVVFCSLKRAWGWIWMLPFLLTWRVLTPSPCPKHGPGWQHMHQQLLLWWKMNDHHAECLGAKLHRAFKSQCVWFLCWFLSEPCWRVSLGFVVWCWWCFWSAACAGRSCFSSSVETDCCLQEHPSRTPWPRWDCTRACVCERELWTGEIFINPTLCVRLLSCGLCCTSSCRLCSTPMRSSTSGSPKT